MSAIIGRKHISRTERFSIYDKINKCHRYMGVKFRLHENPYISFWIMWPWNSRENYSYPLNLASINTGKGVNLEVTKKTTMENKKYCIAILQCSLLLYLYSHAFCLFIDYLIILFHCKAIYSQNFDKIVNIAYEEPLEYRPTELWSVSRK
jgi:hypothetical protein